MPLLNEIIARHTAGISSMHIDYSDELPNAQLIAAECRDEEVHELLQQIEELSRERERADQSGNVNGDDLDFVWGKIARHASLLPHLVPRFLPVVAAALQSPCMDVRLFVAQAFSKSPSAKAAPFLKARIAVEPPGPVLQLLQQAFDRCQEKQSWVRRLLS